MSPSAIAPIVCNSCNLLRDDGMSYGNYVEQLTPLSLHTVEESPHR
ncbi:hypothetical protein DNFV4_02606 [Nitrospira tepida]|uniref:Uncharacterized protein n=1 Tax=Nitrospira tepida TaxID=2973512 RepID=A0AA86T8B8_9BACT|nr:hypothetical protein DNFV4_02606 [Nitrospira tepida]